MQSVYTYITSPDLTGLRKRGDLEMTRWWPGSDQWHNHSFKCNSENKISFLSDCLFLHLLLSVPKPYLSFVICMHGCSLFSFFPETWGDQVVVQEKTILWLWRTHSCQVYFYSKSSCMSTCCKKPAELMNHGEKESRRKWHLWVKAVLEAQICFGCSMNAWVAQRLSKWSRK